MHMLYFGVLKEFFGAERDTLELAGGSTVEDLLQVLREQGPELPGAWKAMAVAVNREYAARETLLEDGDEVALLPPVSGGCSGRRFRRETWGISSGGEASTSLSGGGAQ